VQAARGEARAARGEARAARDEARAARGEARAARGEARAARGEARAARGKARAHLLPQPGHTWLPHAVSPLINLGMQHDGRSARVWMKRV
jgi:hypothetical protein